uniref:auxin-responsive protein SAUR36-like n=1 Tax=Erigeron canadensis TaxID=72917 RepID=UPI001CB990C1|nr:auxin-responsive protein SAUR36-like [Erigeron canadensis]
MKKFRGFLLKRRVISLFRCTCRRYSRARGYRRLNPSHISSSRILKWVDKIKSKALEICSKQPGHNSGYLRFRQDPVVPKGKLAVYIGQNDGVYERVLVPVIYINHPLFGQLLQKVEDEYGHEHAGGITIPCRKSEFENVKTRIAAGSGGRKVLTWKRSI